MLLEPRAYRSLRFQRTSIALNCAWRLRGCGLGAAALVPLQMRRIHVLSGMPGCGLVLQATNECAQRLSEHFCGRIETLQIISC